ncbi:bifunctional Target SNARE coiled-coil homology domain/SNARE/Syntaxin [Babesia duncani]|uniref:Bifunctional Target SNARE coiled-coil homology domain/SNARE/Syntaxin n=1 Tax=Babesia duncani TaxID=323732 RepID=A0AAD9UP51_9APIC|nr:bifunctional Target SNARE coiled-coil homology domain/SNARE/Syntaxin [Babesia duncani]
MVRAVNRTAVFKREALKNISTNNASGVTAFSKNALDQEADTISHVLAICRSKTSELSQIAKKRGIFVEYTQTIEDLTGQIKDGLTVASNSIDKLERNIEQHNHENHHVKLHYSNLLGLLRKDMFDITTSLKEILHERAQIIVQQENRRKLYSHNYESAVNTNANKFGRRKFALQQEIESDQRVDIESGETIRPSRSVIADAKTEALANVQRAIGDLAQIFQKVTTLVTQQDEMIQRIDADTELSYNNVLNAYDELRRYYKRISNKGGLILKVTYIFSRNS